MPSKKKEPSSQPAHERIAVEIFGSTYTLRGGDDADAVRALAADLDEKMHALAHSAPDADPVKVAILTALRMGDEMHRSHEDRAAQDDALAERVSSCADRLERLLDTARSPSPGDSVTESEDRRSLDGAPSVG